MWPWLARMDKEVGHTRLSCHEEVPLLNLLFILSWCNTIHWYLCMIYSEQQLESGCSIVYNGPDIMGDEDENLAEDSAVGKPWVMQVKG